MAQSRVEKGQVEVQLDISSGVIFLQSEVDSDAVSGNRAATRKTAVSFIL